MSSKTKAVLALGGILLFIGAFSHASSPKPAVQGIQATIPVVTTHVKLPTISPTPTNIPPTYTPTPWPTSVQIKTCAGATAICNDGSCSYSAHHQGTCSHHGGVAEWL
jgi:hypothetical protein